MSGSKCEPYTIKACRDAALSSGLKLGSASNAFVGDEENDYFLTRGCHAYSSGGSKGVAYYGTGGTTDEMKSLLLPEGDYRPVGYDCNNLGI